MSNGYVFDAEAIIAFLYDEPGHESVASLLDGVFDGDREGYLSETNTSEVYYLVARFEGDDDTPTPESLRIADRDVRALDRRGLSIERADWRIASEIKAHGGLSLADAHAVSLACTRNVTLVAGGDGDFDDLPVDVDVLRFRDHGI